MSAKARASLMWDDAHLTGVLRVLKPVIRTLSSITLAIVLLSVVSVYGILASVPVGLLAQIPTWLVKAGLLAGAWMLIACVPAAVLWRALSRRSKGSAFIGAVVAVTLLTPIVWWLWMRFGWPRLRFDPVSGSGVMFFAGFVEQYKSTTLRRLPGMEMSEADFYAWWPLRVVLTLFILNMVVATLRRIEFIFKNVGVLCVHTGIILISLGSAYYGGLKVEGDTFLGAGNPGADARPGDGPPQSVFYDAQRVAVFADQGRGWEQRPIRRLPRYNDYGLDAAGKSLSLAANAPADPTQTSSGPLRIELSPSDTGSIDDDFSFAVVGYASYAEGIRRWTQTASGDGSPLMRVYLHSTLPTREGVVSDAPVFEFALSPHSPIDRWTATDVFALEVTAGPAVGMSPTRWADLSEPLPPGSRHGLVIDIASTGERKVVAVESGNTFAFGGFSFTVDRIEEAPSLPIITPGYRGATSSLAVVKVTTPTGEVFDRYVYHRFPELDQDLLAVTNPAGMPVRRTADPTVRLGFIDASRLGVYIDAPAGAPARGIVRQAAGAVRIFDDIQPTEPVSDPTLAPHAGWLRDIVPKISLRIGETTRDAAKLLGPRSIPENERTDKDAIGTHRRAMIAVEVRSTKKDWKAVRWMAFSRYLDPQTGPDIETVVTPDGRELRLAFGRFQHAFPGFAIQYVDFEMIAYDFRGSPRDYQSTVRVMPAGREFDPYVHIAKLNEPLRAPVSWNDEAAWVSNAANRLLSGLDPRQFKLSQSGWDAQGWQQTQQLSDEGKAPGPTVRFTILHVGNNPGIHIVALGAIFMVLGIPWAFYVKPWLLQREKRRIQALVAEGRYVPPGRSAPASKLDGVHTGSPT